MSLDQTIASIVRQEIREAMREERPAWVDDLSVRSVDEWLTVQDVAMLVKFDEETVRRWITRGTLKATKVGREWRVKRSDLERFMASDDGLTDEDIDAKVIEIMQSRRARGA